MGKVIKFPGSDDNENKTPKKEENLVKKEEDIELNLKNAVEEHVLQNFAVKNILGMDIVYKIHPSSGEFGIIGVMLYEHKRRAGIFKADFIAKGYIDKKTGKAVVSTLAYQAGEPDLYMSIYNTLKAKKLLPSVD